MGCCRLGGERKESPGEGKQSERKWNMSQGEPDLNCRRLVKGWEALGEAGL